MGHPWSGFPGDPRGKEPTCKGDIRDASLVPGLGRSCGGGHDNPLQYSCLENPMDWAWRATEGSVHRIAKSWTRLQQLSTFLVTSDWSYLTAEEELEWFLSLGSIDCFIHTNQKKYHTWRNNWSPNYKAYPGSLAFCLLGITSLCLALSLQ